MHDRALPVGHSAISEFWNLLYYYEQPLIISVVTSIQRCSQIFMESLLILHSFSRRNLFILNKFLISGKILITCRELYFKVFFFFIYSVSERDFQDYFTHREEPINRWGEMAVPWENHLTHPQAELVLSHMWPVRDSNLHQTRQ